MTLLHIEEQTYSNRNADSAILIKAHYERCIFDHRDFREADFSDFMFSECTFRNCNLSMVKLEGTAIRECAFYDSKLVGLLFHQCHLMMLSMSFHRCTLHLCSFQKLNMKAMILEQCALLEVDFTETDLSNVNFDRCDCDRTIFFHTNLEKADFRTALRYNLNPEHNRVKKARFSYPACLGLLDSWNIIIED